MNQSRNQSMIHVIMHWLYIGAVLLHPAIVTAGLVKQQLLQSPTSQAHRRVFNYLTNQSINLYEPIKKSIIESSNQLTDYSTLQLYS